MLCDSRLACCLLYYLCEINKGNNIASLPLNFCTSVSRCGFGFRFEQKYWWIDRFSGKGHGSVDLHTLIHPSPAVGWYGSAYNSLQAGSPLSHAHKRQRAKQSGGKESGEEAPRKCHFLVSWLRRLILCSQLCCTRLRSNVSLLAVYGYTNE